MKKVLIVLATSALFAACNDSSTSSTEATTDSTSTMMSTDSSTMAPAMADSSTMSADTTMKK